MDVRGVCVCIALWVFSGRLRAHTMQSHLGPIQVAITPFFSTKSKSLVEMFDGDIAMRMMNDATGDPLRQCSGTVGVRITGQETNYIFLFRVRLCVSFGVFKYLFFSFF
ncbi:hypothetical protein OUZ56_004242 [Daphnia magna]|uniref:Secreted protein n=1 Tax=Daphnia magna TaxID=35525 RepID=A0ABQ9YP63_9CRUS|nr:hypothetical protein OUZ56_004242 [Daphnia magna]